MQGESPVFKEIILDTARCSSLLARISWLVARNSLCVSVLRLFGIMKDELPFAYHVGIGRNSEYRQKTCYAAPNLGLSN